MEITIKIDRCMVSVEVSAKVAECLDAGKHKTANLSHEKRRHWDDREFDEYIIAAEGRLPYMVSPEEQVCQWEIWDEIMAVLDLCTEAQRERLLLHALYDFSYAEIAEMCGCTKVTDAPCLLWEKQSTPIGEQQKRNVGEIISPTLERRKMDTRNEIKSYIVREGFTMAELVEKLAEQYGWSASVPNLSGKLRRDSLRLPGGRGTG